MTRLFTFRRNTIGFTAAAAVIAAGLTVPAAQPAHAAPKGRPATQVTTPVKVIAVTPVAGTKKVPVTAGGLAPRTVTSGASVVTLPAAGTLVDAGSTGVKVGRAATAPGAKTTGPEAVTVQTAKAGTVPRVHLKSGAPGKVTVRVDVSGYRHAIGGDWASRLRLVDTSACNDAATGQGCAKATPILTTFDAASGSLTGEVTLTATPTATRPSSSDATDAQEFSATVMAASGASGSSGDFGASDLAASSSWSAGGASGDLSWSYPMSVPPSIAGLEPDVALAYSAQSVDGRATSTNNQPSWVGEGFNLGQGFIERNYVGCADDMTGSNTTVKTGDLCWKSDSAKTNNETWDNATLSFGSHSGALVRVANTNTWRLRRDDGTRVEKLTGAFHTAAGGEYWKVTTTDGTQYFFGKGKPSSAGEVTNSAWTVPVYGNQSGEPGYVAGSFATSKQDRPWRWNLDHVVTPDGDTATYYYTTETNRYAANKSASVSYVRGGTLARIDYGQRNGAEHLAKAPMQVAFTVAERCFNDTALPNCAAAGMTSANAYHWPDVPFDQICAATCSTTTQTSPTFFTRKRLASVTTGLRNSAGTGYDLVDRWTLTHSYPDPGDGTSPSLFLTGIQRQGLTGTAITLPKVEFFGQVMDNRVDGIDGAAPFRKWRVYAINSESGSTLAWTYSAKDCTPTSVPVPETNTRRCFPVYFTPPGGSVPERHWFHKYRIDSVTETDRSGASVNPLTTTYTYGGTPAWHYDENPFTQEKYRTWGDWRGYGQVTTTSGRSGSTQSQTISTYLRGMHGDRLNTTGGTKTVTVTDSLGTSVNDDWRTEGMTREFRAFNGPGGALVGATLTDAWLPSATTATDGRWTAQMSGTAGTRERTTITSGTRETNATTLAFDAYGMPTQVQDEGDVVVTGDEECTRTTYARNTTAWILDAEAEVQTTKGLCSVTPTTANALSLSRTYYDNSATLAAAPTRGNATRVDELVDTPTGRAVTTQGTTVVDVYGRETASTDALGRTTATAYSPSTGVAPTTITTTSPDPDGPGPLVAHVTRESIDQRRGVTTASTDAAGRVTATEYDALGRAINVWAPGRVKGTDTPTAKYTYTISATGPNAVTTENLIKTGGYVKSVAFFDGLLRPRGTQASVEGTGRVVTETLYDSRGLVAEERSGIYDNTTNPNTTLVTVAATAPERTIAHTYDGAARETITQMKRLGTELWRTTQTHTGDRVAVNPPAGGTPELSVTDAHGRVIEKQTFDAATATGTPKTTTKYTYDDWDNLATTTDTKGKVWSKTYNLQGELMATTDPDKGPSQLAYDAVGNLTSTNDARGKKVTTTYDQLDRPTKVANTAGTALTEYAYDVLPNGTAARGALATTTRHVGAGMLTQSVTSLDTAGRPLTSSTTVPEVAGIIPTGLKATITTTNTYFTDGSPNSVATAGIPGLPNETVKYLYDTLGRQNAMGGIGSYVGDMVWSPFGEPLQYAMGNTLGKELWHTFTYEQGTRRLATARVDRENVLTADLNTTYAYDNAGNVTSTTGTTSAGVKDTQCFRYDRARVLTDAWTPADNACSTDPTTATLGGPAPYRTTWTVDVNGNRLSETHRRPGQPDRTTTQTYGATQPHFTSTAAVTTGTTTVNKTYAADAAGNTTGRPGTTGQQTLTWDDEGHLTKVAAGATVLQENVYDADGQRLVRKTGGKTTLTLGSVELTHDTATGAVTGQRYYSFHGRTVAVRTGAGTAAVTYLFGDHHGTGDVQIGATTSAVTLRRTTPYGEDRTQTGTWIGDKGFVGGTEDNAIGLTHLGARDYDPALGRFISVDPLLDDGDPRQLNAYQYGYNNPLAYSDPDGLRPLGAGDTGCSNCKPVYVAPKEHGTKRSYWHFGNERWGSASVHGKRSSSYKYKGGSNHKKNGWGNNANDAGSRSRQERKGQRQDKAAQVSRQKSAYAKAFSAPRMTATDPKMRLVPTMRHCETSGATFGCGGHEIIHKTSVVLTGAALAADLVAVGCGGAAIVTAGASLVCSGYAAQIGTITGSAAAALDVLDMTSGGKPFSGVDLAADMLAPVSLGASKWLSRLPAGLEAATRVSRLDARIGQEQLIGGGIGGASAPFDTGGFITGLIGWDE